MRYDTVGKGYIVLTVLVIVAVGMLGCSEESRLGSSDVTAPIVTLTEETITSEAEQLANFGAVNRGINLEGGLTLVNPANKYVLGLYFDPQFLMGGPGIGAIPWLQLNAFWVYVTEPGDYLLTYETWYGAFHIMFRTPEPGAIAIYLHPRDVAFNVTMTKGMIPAGVSEAPTDLLGNLDQMQVFGMVPYMGDAPSEFIPMEVTPLIVNMLPNPDVGLCPPGAPCDPWR